MSSTSTRARTAQVRPTHADRGPAGAAARHWFSARLAVGPVAVPSDAAPSGAAAARKGTAATLIAVPSQSSPVAIGAEIAFRAQPVDPALHLSRACGRRAGRARQ